MKVALLSDIHGNNVALEAVLADIAQRGGADCYWILGDLVALGPEPAQVLERLTSLPEARFISGNTDRYVFSGDRPGPTLEEAAAAPAKLHALVEVAHTFAWTQGRLAGSGWIEWLEALPKEFRVTLPDGTHFLGAHAAPGRDDGAGITVETSEDDLARIFAGCEAKLVALGHTHRPCDRIWRDIRLLNLGAVSLSLARDKTASYALLDATCTHYSVQHCSVRYDRSAVVRRLEQLRHPARSYLIKHLLDG